MKIVNVTSERREVKLKKPFKTALRQVTSIEVIDVKVELENGEIGFGSASSTWKITGDSMEGMEAAIHGPIKEAIIDKDIVSLGSILTDLQRSCVGNTSAKAAVDMALHDTYCRMYQIPLYAYLGGKTNVVETDMTVSIDHPDVMYKEATEIVDQGFKVLKIKVGNDAKQDIYRIEKVREAAGDHVHLRLDANQGWTSKQAVQIIKHLERENMGIELVEQPVPANDIEGLKFIRERVATPVMADESAFSPNQSLQLLKTGAVDLINIKLMKSGGIRQAWQIADICQAAGIECMIGSMMESIASVTAAAHVAVAHPNITYYDLDAPLWMADEGLKGGMQYNGSIVELQDRNGLGIG
ncbi:dipeptide epimerase [Radiobacillus kanasensis]|uniref:dipeptide epimerase n=1 Tax=Radiobacillus kanasensis TaxID=2844358 RepID=UPI001E2EAAA4|nr:dipeptide epimerase [Radiobacillus kanasensis]UFT98847.1 dipeptide epimerase [Radiobacillus kanasensis]